MGSNQRDSIYQMVKMNKTGPKVTVSTQKGAEITNTAPQRRHGSIAVSTQRSPGVSVGPSTHQRSEARHSVKPNSSSDYRRSTSPESGLISSGVPIPRGPENRSKSESYRHVALQRKIQQTQVPFPHAVQVQQDISPPREEATQRRAESKSGRDSNPYSLIPDTKSFRHLSFADRKDNVQTLQEDPPSKVLYPQGVRVPRKSLVSPKDEAVQTEPIRKSVTAAEIKSPRKASVSPPRGNKRVSMDSRTTQRRVPGQESETGRHSSISTEPKALHRNKNLESSLTFSVLKDVDGGRRVSMYTALEPTLKHSAYTEPKPSLKVLASPEAESSVKTPVRADGEAGRRVTISSGVQPMQTAPCVTSRAGSESPRKASMFTFPEPVYKQHIHRASESVCMSPPLRLKHPEPSSNPSFHAKVELTPRPLPPRSLPKYGPESSWWALLNTEVEVPQSQPTTPDFEAKSSPPIDYSLSSFEMDSNPFCEDLMFWREKASASPPPAPATPPPPPPQFLKEPPSQAPLRGMPQAPKCTSKQPIQRFSAFFLGM